MAEGFAFFYWHRRVWSGVDDTGKQPCCRGMWRGVHRVI